MPVTGLLPEVSRLAAEPVHGYAGGIPRAFMQRIVLKESLWSFLPTPTNEVNPSEHGTLTMTHLPSKSCTVTTLSQLAKPWVYRRQGRYTLRVRLLGSCTDAVQLSLRTTDRPTAMTTAKHLLSTLRTFHLDNPEATWDQLRERLKEIAEDALATGSVWGREDMGLGQVYSDLRDDLLEIARTMPLTVPQAKAVSAGSRVLQAAEGRLQGDLEGLVDVIEELKDGGDLDSIILPSPSLSRKGALKAPAKNTRRPALNGPSGPWPICTLMNEKMM